MPEVSIFWSNSGVKRKRAYGNTVIAGGILIPDSKSRQNLLSGSIQYIYTFTYQSASLSFKHHGKMYEFSKIKLLVPHI